MSSFIRKKENIVLAFLLLFSVSIGLWNNFRQLWMQSNNMNVGAIGSVISFGTLICVVAILIFSKYINIGKIKSFISSFVLLKIIILITLFFLNKSSFVILINVLVITDIILERLIIISIYPLITTIKVSDKLYGKRKLTEYLGRDLGILIGGIFLGKTIMNIVIDYNVCLIITVLFSIVSLIVLLNTTIEKREIHEIKQNIFKYIFSNKHRRLYMIYYLITQISYSAVFGLQILILTHFIKFSDVGATRYLLVVGILADIIGILCLKYFQPKNDYLTISIKFGLRAFWYILAFMTNNMTIIIIAISWSILISTAYENVTDAPYVNAVSLDKQLPYANLRYMTKSLGEAIGVYICTFMFDYGIRYILLAGGLLVIIQLIIGYVLIYQRKCDN